MTSLGSRLAPGTALLAGVAITAALAGIVLVSFEPLLAMLAWLLAAMFGGYVWAATVQWRKKTVAYERQQTAALQDLDRRLAAGELSAHDHRELQAAVEGRPSPEEEYQLAVSSAPGFGSPVVRYLGWAVLLGGFALIAVDGPWGPWIVAIGLLIAITSLVIRPTDRKLLADQVRSSIDEAGMSDETPDS